MYNGKKEGETTMALLGSFGFFFVFFHRLDHQLPMLTVTNQRQKRKNYCRREDDYY